MTPTFLFMRDAGVALVLNTDGVPLVLYAQDETEPDDQPFMSAATAQKISTFINIHMDDHMAAYWRKNIYRAGIPAALGFLVMLVGGAAGSETAELIGGAVLSVAIALGLVAHSRAQTYDKQAAAWREHSPKGFGLKG